MLDETLLGKTRAALLREVYLNPDRRLSFNDLVRRIGSGAGAVSRELKTLLEAGLIREQREGNQRLISAAVNSPVFPELRALIAKTSGVPAVVREALGGLEQRIEVAIIIGSVARGSEHEDSDLDLFVVGSAGYSVLSRRMQPIEDRLGRHVQVLYYDINSRADRASLAKPASRALVAGPKLFVLGNEARLASILKEDTDDGHQKESRKSRETKAPVSARRRSKLGNAKRAR